MASMKYNKNPISLREGSIFIDGVEVADSVNCTINFTPDTWTGRTLGETIPSTRWLGGSISGTITRRRSTDWLKQAIKKYIDSKETPEFTIQGIMDDKNSDYYDDFGDTTVTVVGCVLTGDLNLITLESEGEIVDDSISFSGKGLV